ncbi:hypothetical protein QN224_29890 [Sinorhizobium sp. 8-89]|nr:hypothetical protein [Sinorhizobium sp. 7-81]MDK1389595.1 hypothetical protein [Sinorhizobium sp. 7-81]
MLDRIKKKGQPQEAQLAASSDADIDAALEARAAQLALWSSCSRRVAGLG